MKKGYVVPDAEIISFKLTDDVLFHSPIEVNGKNNNWTWNDDDENGPNSYFNNFEDLSS